MTYKVAENLAERWISSESLPPENTSNLDVASWSTMQTLIFLEHLTAYTEKHAPFPASFLECLDSLYSFTASNNSEIKFRWQSLCLQSNVPWIVPHVVDFITSQGAVILHQLFVRLTLYMTNFIIAYRSYEIRTTSLS